jgi:hypothetical protein
LDTSRRDRYRIKPKPLQARPAFDRTLRQRLREKFPESVTRAFAELDMDGDARLSREDLARGLSERLGMRVTDDVAPRPAPPDGTPPRTCARTPRAPLRAWG